MSFLDKQHSHETYFENIKHKSKSYAKNTEKAVKHFEKWCKITHNKTREQVFAELNSFDDKKKEQKAYDILQEYVNYLSIHVQPNVLKMYFSMFKKYFVYLTELKIHSEDIQDKIQFPKVIEEEGHPLEINQIKEILKYANNEKRLFYMVMISSGMRPQEVCKIKKRDIMTDYPRLLVKLPGKYTKTGKPRRTFIGSEIEDDVRKKLDKLSFDDLVFTKQQDSELAVSNERTVFDDYRRKAGYDDLRYDSGTHKITIHSFRSFFITKTEKIHEGLGHALAGHGRYMKRYERYSDQELLEFYIQVEPELFIYTQSVDKKTKELEERIKELEGKLASMAHRTRKERYEKGVLELKIKELIRQELENR